MSSSMQSRRMAIASMSAVFSLAATRTVAAPFDRARLGNTAVSIERGFVTVGYGQLHYRRAAPLDQRKIKRRPVVCFHQTPNSSQVFIEFMGALARDRIVYAVDTPGLGQSDLPLQPPEISDYATAMFDFLKAKRLRKVDLVGYHTGASIACELSLLCPERINRMMLVGIALLNAEERAGFFNQPWPAPTQADGSHLKTSWDSSFRWQGPGQSDASVKRSFIEKTSAGETGWWGARAVMRHDLAATMKKVTTAFFAINPNDDLFRVTPRLSEIRPDVRIVTKAEFGFGIFEIDHEAMATLARDYFDQCKRQ